MNHKSEFAHAVATLLCLDRGMELDLMKLQEGTLVKMYNMYIQNAKESNNQMERLQDAHKQMLTASEHKGKNKITKRRVA